MLATQVKKDLARLEKETSFSIYDLECATGHVGQLVYASPITASSLKQVG
jgi:hypothetical protein